MTSGPRALMCSESRRDSVSFFNIQGQSAICSKLKGKIWNFPLKSIQTKRNSKTDLNHTFTIKWYVYYFKANSTLHSLAAITSPNFKFERVVPNLEELLQYTPMSKMTGMPINTNVDTTIKSMWKKPFQLKDSRNFQIKSNKNISILIPLHPYSTLQWLPGGHLEKA